MVLMFETEVAEDEIISVIKSAIEAGKFDPLNLNASSIIGITPVEQPSTAAPTRTTPKSKGLFLVVIDNGIMNLRGFHSFASCCFKLDSL